jgi:hypothetical protein
MSIKKIISPYKESKALGTLSNGSIRMNGGYITKEVPYGHSRIVISLGAEERKGEPDGGEGMGHLTLEVDCELSKDFNLYIETVHKDGTIFCMENMNLEILYRLKKYLNYALDGYKGGTFQP